MVIFGTLEVDEKKISKVQEKNGRKNKTNREMKATL